MFIGCVESSKRLLQSLFECNIDIVGVITKKQSSYNADFVDLSVTCEKNAIDYRYVDNINDDDAIKYIKSKEPDLIYCFGWSQLISKEIIDIPKIGVIGFHPAELPQNRGRHPIVWALALGLKRTASTFFFITEGADEGDIISQEIIPIDDTDNAQVLYNKILNIAEKQIKKFTEQFCENSIIKVAQDSNKTNYWRKRTEKDGEIDWRMSAKSIYNLVRALSKPYVGAHFIYHKQIYKVWKSKIVECDEYHNIEYGKVLQVLNNTSFKIKTGEGILLIEECDPIQLIQGEYLL